MNYLISILLITLAAPSFAQQVTCWQGDSAFKVRLSSDDTTRVKVYNNEGLPTKNPLLAFDVIVPALPLKPFSGPSVKYDTIGPMWRLVSDTAVGHWNPVSAMRVYNVRKYESQYVDLGGEKHSLVTPKHYAWLDSNRKPLKQAVWRAEIDK